MKILFLLTFYLLLSSCYDQNKDTSKRSTVITQDSVDKVLAKISKRTNGVKIPHIDTAESVQFKTLENNNAELNIWVDYNHGEISFSLLSSTETVCASGLMDLIDVKVWNDRFVACTYQVHGGSGVAVHEMVIFCEANGKLYQCLHVYSMVSSDVILPSDSIADVKDMPRMLEMDSLSVLKIENNNGNYSLTAKRYVGVKYDKEPERNHEKEEILQFSFEKNIFYATHKILNGKYIMPDKTTRIFKGDKYPVMTLKKEDDYYFIDNQWYYVGRNKELIPSSQPCNPRWHISDTQKFFKPNAANVS